VSIVNPAPKCIFDKYTGICPICKLSSKEVEEAKKQESLVVHMKLNCKT